MGGQAPEVEGDHMDNKAFRDRQELVVPSMDQLTEIGEYKPFEMKGKTEDRVDNLKGDRVNWED